MNCNKKNLVINHNRTEPPGAIAGKGAPSMITKIDNCQLEIDKNQGVIYVHSPRGITLLRICRVPREILLNRDFSYDHLEMIDVVYGMGKIAREI